MIQFFETLMGRRFYEGDVPRIAKALERIADSLEKLEKNKDEKKEDGHGRSESGTRNR